MKKKEWKLYCKELERELDEMQALLKKRNEELEEVHNALFILLAINDKC